MPPNAEIAFWLPVIVCFLGCSWNQHVAPVRAHFHGSHTPIRIRSTAYFRYLGPCRTTQGGQVIPHLLPLFRSSLYTDASHFYIKHSKEILPQRLSLPQLCSVPCKKNLLYLYIYMSYTFLSRYIFNNWLHFPFAKNRVCRFLPSSVTYTNKLLGLIKWNNLDSSQMLVTHGTRWFEMSSLIRECK